MSSAALNLDTPLATRHPCVYRGGQIELLFTPVSTVSITSDGRPFDHSAAVWKCQCCGLLQKQSTASWRANVDHIYVAYASQSLSQGEAAVVDGKPRSALIVENVVPCLPKSGKLLDIGTGSGVFLAAAKHTTELTLCAQDVNNNHRPKLQKIGVEHTYFEPLADIDEQFEVMTAIHVIEHVLDVIPFYRDIARLLTPDGVFIAQVPQSDENSFDLLIYDHLFHFNRCTLHLLLQPYFDRVWFPKQLYKEITVMFSKQALAAAPAKIDNHKLDNKLPDVERINRILQAALCQEAIAVFGSDPNSAYAVNVLGDRVRCVVDDDPLKVGKQLLGKTIIAACDLPPTLAIVIPFPVRQAHRIAQRLEDRYVIY